ncbi:EAL domain-containing response regulator [Enterovibrio nigricans]|uniref:EAL domain, c-di-GMP-specific phosphodiesterase class I (Or its enzymatically inactive variant) n=1 Tax=Enterovibrio nigricans DSM 22720 TaxID=1121868 RepID=A0A1T4UQL0_9GAMM|nr:EAL domain-containing response regulator [Enterovibrio nigricans]SKA54721.1 EAL domain, c-di-GMP-specific phosphodiesterase class I (or its enzymatically inactive variant) [Enterovibrio nigricans DSM 22720]
MKRSRRVMVIDDSESILALMVLMLNELGYNEVCTHSSPQEALKQLKRSPQLFDIVFTDLNMPEIDGMAVIRELGEIKYQGGICIISDLDVRIIELAAEVARQQHVCLLGNIAKPITSDGLRLIFNRMTHMEERKFVNFKKMTKDELLDCIIRHQIIPYYQPKLNPENNLVESLEVLARINLPSEMDAVLPGRFIPTAIENDLMDLLTMQLAEKTALDMSALSSIFGNQVKVSINLAPQQLANLDIPNRLESLFDAKHIAKSRIVLEITEEYELKSTEQMESLNRLRIRGYGLSLDDFGTGFTNIQQLRSLPFTEVKIDRTLINQIHCDQFSQVIVSSLTDIADRFKVDLVAEGIEHFEDLDYLTSRYPGILLQGFLISRPRPLETLSSWYQQWLKSVETTYS